MTTPLSSSGSCIPGSLVMLLAGWSGLGCPAVPSDQGCVEGTSQACTCTDGRSGAQLCRPDGIFDPCRCAGSGDAGVVDGAVADAATSDANQGTSCENLCRNVYDCGFSFNDTNGNSITEVACVQQCDGGAFSSAEVTCFTAAACTSTAMNACWGAGGPVCPRDADCTGRVCGNDPVCSTSCGACAGTSTCNSGWQCASPQGWIVETVAMGYPDDVTLAIDGAGSVQALWVTGSGDLTWGRRAGGAWSSSVVEAAGTLSLGVEQLINLDFQVDNTPHATYLAPAHGALRHAIHGSSSWAFESIETTASVGGYASMKVDSQGRVHVSYRDEPGDQLKYALRDGLGAWQIEVVDSTPYSGIWTSLDLASDDTPRIAFVRGYASVYLASPSGTSWHVDVVDSGGQPGFVSLALDQGDAPHLSYFQRTTQVLRHATPDGVGGWTLTTVDSVGDGNAWNDIAVDGAGNVSIAYTETSLGNLKLARRVSGVWSNEVIDGDSAAQVGMNCAIALDSAGKPRILYKSTRYQSGLMFAAAP
ncbi:MAG: hypothetical protein ABIJ09_22520 [Pseudomonadota bacterium]